MRILLLTFGIALITISANCQIFHENFEIPDSVISSSNGSGIWDLNNRLAISGMNSDSASINNVGDTIVLTTIPFSTVGYDSIFLYFNQICKIEFFDNGYLEVSTDSGITWAQLKDDMGGANNNCIYHGNGLLRTQGRFQEASYATWEPGVNSTPNNSWWKREIFDISTVLYNVPYAQIRFVTTDGNNNGGAGRSGWFIEDVFIDSTLNTDLNVFRNLITGKVFYDLNSNDVQDSGELPITGLKVEETNSTNWNFTDSTGFFNFRTNSSGTITIQTDSNALWAPYFVTSPTTHMAVFSGVGEIDSLNDFAVQPFGITNDLRVSLTTNNNFWPGMNTLLTINYSNIGNVTLNPSITFLCDTLISFDSTSVTPTFVSPDSIVWNFANLMPFQSGIISIFMTTNINIIDTVIINTSVVINPVLNDITPINNYDSSSVILEFPDFIEDSTDYSLDPNYITVNHDTVSTQNLFTLPYLEYVINFQNIGTGPADRVIIENLINDNLDINTFELIGFSHDVELVCNSILNPRILYYTFESINLPDSNSNEPASHGFVKYHIKPLTSLVAGEIITNNASIFFDFNAPVATNTVITTIIDPTSLNEEQVESGQLQVYPNPAFDEITLIFNSNSSNPISLDIFNIYGQKVKTLYPGIKGLSTSELKFDISDLSEGVYFIRLENVIPNITAKFVKM